MEKYYKKTDDDYLIEKKLDDLFNSINFRFNQILDKIFNIYQNKHLYLVELSNYSDDKFVCCLTVDTLRPIFFIASVSFIKVSEFKNNLRKLSDIGYMQILNNEVLSLSEYIIPARLSYINYKCDKDLYETKYLVDLQDLDYLLAKPCLLVNKHSISEFKGGSLIIGELTHYLLLAKNKSKVQFIFSNAILYSFNILPRKKLFERYFIHYFPKITETLNGKISFSPNELKAEIGCFQLYFPYDIDAAFLEIKSQMLELHWDA